MSAVGASTWAVVRWAWRLFRREWRSQVLIVGLLALTVGAAVVSTSAAYNTSGVSDDAELGRANLALRMEVAGPEALQAAVQTVEDRVGDVEVIARWSTPVPGSVDSVEYRAQDPAAPLGAPMVALRDGRYPRGADEVAVTQGLAESFGLEIGSRFDLDGVARQVVAVVENPFDLDVDFALLAPTDVQMATAATLLIAGDVEGVDAFVSSRELPSDIDIIVRSEGAGLGQALSVLGAAYVVLVLVALVAAAGFVVVAERRLRQLGMLAAVGATSGQVRLVTLAHGAVVGLVGAALGAGVGAVGWILAGSTLEQAFGHRLDPWGLPWPIIVLVGLLAVATATAAAWWPSRVVSRVSAVRAFSGRPSPAPRPAPGSVALVVLLVAGGVACLVLSRRANPVLLGVGSVATVVGFLLVSPVALRALSSLDDMRPVAARLALRSLARHQTRSAMALAAISMALGIPMATLVVAAATEYEAGIGNLADNQLLFRSGVPDDPVDVVAEPGEVSRLDGLVQRIAAQLDDPTISALEAVQDPGSESLGTGQAMAVILAEPAAAGEEDQGWSNVGLLYVATDELLDHYGAAVDPPATNTEVLAVDTTGLWVLGWAKPDQQEGAFPLGALDTERIEPGYSALPGTFVTPAAVERYELGTVRAGWLVTSRSAITGEQLDLARRGAADAGLLVESRTDPGTTGLAAVRARATATGLVLALGVLAMIAGLVRGESANDLRILTAVGATSFTRRTLTATTAGGLAALGVLLAGLGATAALVAGYTDNLAALGAMPVLELVAIVVGVPLLAAAAGWALSGAEPSGLTRQPAE